jgi:quercetin dioxygenase-like cupin family protein
MVRAYRLFTGPDGDSHVERGSVALDSTVPAQTVMFAETPAHASLDWHNAPAPQYVLTLTGTLEFRTRAGDVFTVAPGDVLIALDHTGTGHTWRLIDDAPWKRAYVVFEAGADLRFAPDAAPR